jgi:lambda family phage tail tape measure protein
MARIGAIQLVIAVDSQKMREDLDAAERVVTAFGSSTSATITRLRSDLSKVAVAAGIKKDTDEWKKLFDTFKENRAIFEAQRALERLGKTGALTSQQLGELAKRMNFSATPASQGFEKSNDSITSLTSSIKTLVAAYASFQTVKDIAQTSIKIDSLEKSFYAITGSMEGARGEMSYMRDEAQRLGIDFMALTESYKGFSAAAKFAGINQKSTRDIFQSFTEASTVLGLSGDRTKLVLMALEQMISKGTVSMEELRRQLGDSLPGAFELGAKAMGMTLQEFNKFVATGKLMTLDFLPKFSATIKETFGPGLVEALKTPRAELQRLSNAVTFVQDTIGKGGFLAGLAEGARELRAALETDSTQRNLSELGVALGQTVSLLGKLATFAANNGTILLALGGGLAAATVSAKLFVPAISGMTAAFAGLKGIVVAATGGLAGLQTAITVAGGGLAAFSKLAGPVGAVVGAAASAIYLFSNRQSEGEIYAKNYAASIAQIAKGGDEAKASLDALRTTIKDMSEGQRRLEELRLGRVLEEYSAQLKDFEYKGISFGPELAAVGSGFLEGPFAVAINNFFKSGANDFGTLRDEIAKVGASDSKLVPLVDEMGKVIEKLESANIHIQNLREQTENPIELRFEAHVEQLQNFLKAGQDAINKYYRESKEGKSLAIRGNIDAMLRTRDGLSGVELDRANIAIKHAEKELEELGKGKGQGTTDNAKASIRDLEREISRLNGESEKMGDSLAKKLEQIAKSGKAAGLSVSEVSSLQARCTEAFRADTLKDFDKELLKISGDMQALSKIETQEYLDNWRERLSVPKMNLSSEEVDQRITQLRIAKEQQKEIKDLQVAADFYKDLADKSGEYGASIEYQNKLLDLRAKAWADAGIAMEDIVRMKEYLQRDASRNPFDGMTRGLDKFVVSASDGAAQMEKLFTSTFDGMTDSLTDFAMKGKLSFNDLANSIIRDMMRIAVQQSITAPLASGLSSALGSVFSYFSTTPGVSSNPTYMGPPKPAAFGGVFSGGDISAYSGAVVRGPTLFDYGRQFKAFASGAGLMGEAGPEAILPLERMGNGRLGVEATGVMRPVIQINPVVINNTGKDMQAETETQQNANGGFDIITTLTPLMEQNMAKRIVNGQSSLGAVMERTFGLNRAPQAFR